jgi:hypothetical protein
MARTAVTAVSVMGGERAFSWHTNFRFEWRVASGSQAKSSYSPKRPICINVRTSGLWAEYDQPIIRGGRRLQGRGYREQLAEEGQRDRLQVARQED